MTTWAQFEAAAPEIADAGRRLIYRRPIGEAFLATVRGEATPPRLHAIYVAILDGRLVAFILPSPKATDLIEDGRFALHAHQDPSAPHEFMVRGRARRVLDELTVQAMKDAWYFRPDEGHELFEFDIEHAVLGERPSPDAWPPRYRSWRSGGP